MVDDLYRLLGANQAEVAEQPYDTWLAAFPGLVEDIQRGLDKDNRETIEGRELRPLAAGEGGGGTSWPRYSVRPLPAKHIADNSGRASMGLSDKPAGVVICVAADDASTTAV